jgi:hypothetical protein
MFNTLAGACKTGSLRSVTPTILAENSAVCNLLPNYRWRMWKKWTESSIPRLQYSIYNLQEVQTGTFFFLNKIKVGKDDVPVRRAGSLTHAIDVPVRRRQPKS